MLPNLHPRQKSLNIVQSASHISILMYIYIYIHIFILHCSIYIYIYIYPTYSPCISYIYNLCYIICVIPPSGLLRIIGRLVTEYGMIGIIGILKEYGRYMHHLLYSMDIC